MADLLRKELTPEEKAASPCIYHMRGVQCPYSHAPVPNAKAAAAPKASSGPGISYQSQKQQWP